jgi:hypothetical protein
MACIKPPHNVTPASPPSGPTCSESQTRTILGDRLTSAGAVPAHLNVSRTVVLDVSDVVAPTALAPTTAYVFGDNTYVTDAKGQLAYVRAALSLTPDAPRHRGPQQLAGKSASGTGSVGGHPIARSLGGHPSMVEVQNSNMNVSAWATLENVWRHELSHGKSVVAEIQFAQGDSGTPESPVWLASWSVNGEPAQEAGFLNEGNQLK